MTTFLAIIENYSVKHESGADGMEENKKRVAIKLSTIIDDNGQMEYNTMNHIGALHQAGHADILTFGEEVNGEEVRNLITLQDSSVSIKRSGAVMMHQKFRKNNLTENIFKHPHGAIHMETNTEELTYERNEDKVTGEVNILYTVKLNGQEERKHELKLSYQEEEKN